MIKAITGTKDILPKDIVAWRYLENIVTRVCRNFNYKEIRTPVFEETALFARGIGEDTDIVGKEMYTFLDRSETSVTLKPEMTAAVVRAFIEHSLGKQQSLNKLFYISPMFRQERPQAGRFRQFHQFGIEAIGSDSALLDAEVIQVAYHIIRLLGLKDLVVKINSIGIPSSRENYKKALREYLEDKKDKLSEDSKRRLDTNILRILDSKIESDQELLKDAPLLPDYLDEESKNHFNIVKDLLDKVKIPYEVEPKLVRGLDYYTKTTFEIISNKIGSQSALCGGGRYDLLIEQLGGVPTPAVGFAAGIERILLACENEKSLSLTEEETDFYLVRLEDELQDKIFEFASSLRRRNASVDFDYLKRSVKAQMRDANRNNSKFVIFIGGDEFKNGKVNVKNMKSSEQKEFPLDDFDGLIKLVK